MKQRLTSPIAKDIFFAQRTIQAAEELFNLLQNQLVGVIISENFASNEVAQKMALR